MTLTLSPGRLEPIHWRVMARDLAQQQRVLRRVELLLRVLAALDREAA